MKLTFTLLTVCLLLALLALLSAGERKPNVIFILADDQGWNDAHYRISNAANAGVGNTGPVRARKRSVYEGDKAGLGKQDAVGQRFQNFDTNRDGVLSAEEFGKAGKP